MIVLWPPTPIINIVIFLGPLPQGGWPKFPLVWVWRDYYLERQRSVFRVYVTTLKPLCCSISRSAAASILIWIDCVEIGHQLPGVPLVNQCVEAPKRCGGEEAVETLWEESHLDASSTPWIRPSVGSKVSGDDLWKSNALCQMAAIECRVSYTVCMWWIWIGFH